MEMHFPIACDSGPFQAALATLEQVAHGRVELVQGFLSSCNAAAQLVRIDIDSTPAAGTCQMRVVLQPSDALLAFLAAVRAGDV